MHKSLFLLPLLIVVADQISKWLVITNIEPNTLLRVFALLDLTYVVNRGAAFSMLAGLDNANYLLMPIAIVAVVAIGYWLYGYGHKETKLNQYALLFIMGGAAGNLIDRVRFGHVIDFIAVHYKQWYYPSFNIADSSVIIGAFLMVVSLFVMRKQGQQSGNSRQGKRGA